MNSKSRALDGIVVVAIEQAVAAPFATSRLADAGARVIKIEREAGDFARGYDSAVQGQSAFFVWLNRGKESVVLDIKSAADVTLVKQIISSADVFVQNLAPGAAERSGLGSDQLRVANPRLITCDISGYGVEGPYADMKAYDMLVQAETGLASITGTADAPGRVGVSICDISSGMYAQTAILEALFERERTGLGKGLQISMFDSLADWMTVPLLLEEFTGKSPGRTGMQHAFIAPYGAFKAADGEVVLAIQNEREWASFCGAVLMLPELIGDERFNNNQDRATNRHALTAVIEAVFCTLSRDEVTARLSKASIAYAALNSVGDLSDHPQLRRNAVRSANGDIPLVDTPIRRSSDAHELGAVPSLGQHTDAIRAEFGKNS